MSSRIKNRGDVLKPVTGSKDCEPDPAVGYLFMDRLRKSKDVSLSSYHNQSMLAAKKLINVLHPTKSCVADRKNLKKKLLTFQTDKPMTTFNSPITAFRSQF